MTTYYVATTGSDSGTGAIGDPWRTIQRGVNALGGGDTLLIRGGTYVEAVSVPSAASGTSGAHTTIEAYTGETVVIDGQYQIPGGSTYTMLQKALALGKVVPAGANYRFVPTGATVYHATNSPLVDIGARYVDFEDIKVTRSLGRGVRIYSASGTDDNVTIKNCEISYCRWSCVTAYGTDDVIDGCDLHHHVTFAPFSRSATDLNWSAAIAQSPSNGLIVKDCKIHHGWGEGVILSQNTTVEDCQVYDCFSTHIYIEKADNCIVRRNLVWHTATDYLRSGSPPNGICITNEEQSSPGSGSGSGARIYNNIVIGLSRNFVLFAGSASSYSDVRIYNNTFVNARSLTSKMPYNFLLNSVGAESFYVYNNIFFDSTGALVADATTGTGAQFSYNCWQGHTVPAGMRGTGDVYANPQLKSASASVLNGAIAGNYQILVDSPCIDAGTSSPAAPTDDYFGNARSTVDIGAHEYGGTISTYLYPGFSGTNRSGSAPLTVTLTDASTSNETITARYWYYKLSSDSTWLLFDSGNNTSTVLQINSEGTYDVRLRCITATQDASETKTSFATATAPGVDPGDPGDTGSSGASGVVGMATVAANTTTGDQTITLNNSSITPTFALVTVSAATASGSADGAIISVGMTDGTRTRSVGVTATDALATSVAGRSSRDDNLIVISDGGTRRDARADFVAFGAGYITINWSVAPPTGYTINVLAIQADDAYVGDETVAGSMAVTAPNFQPDVIFWLSGFGVFPSSGANTPVTIGVTTADTTGAISLDIEDSAASGSNNGYVFDGAVGITNTAGTVQWSFVPTITATGWSSGALTGTAFGDIGYACIRLASDSVWCDVVDSATATGAATNSTPGFLGGAAFGIFSNMTAAGSAVTDGTAGSLSVGMWAGTAQASVGISNESSADPTDAASHRSANRFVHVVDDDGATVAAQAYISSDASGYSLDWETAPATATKGIILLFEGVATNSGGGGGATSGVVAYGTAAANTSTGNQTITLNSAITPTFALVVMTAATAGSNPAAHAILSVGMTDGTNVRAVGMAAEDNVATSNAGRVSRNDNLIVEDDFATGRLSRATFVSFGEGEITVNWSTAPAAAYTIHVWAVAADDAYVGDETVASSMAVTSPNFQSDIIFWLVAGGSFLSSGNDALISFGISTADTTGMIGVGWDDAQADGANSGYMIDGSVVLANSTGGRNWEFTPTITATGWSGTLTGSATGAIAYGCLRLAGNSVWCDVLDSATATGSVDNTTPGFPAGAGIAILSALAASGSAATDGTAGTFGIGMWAGTAQASVGISNESSADPTDTASHSDADSFIKLMDDDGTTTLMDAAVSSHAEGYSLNWATAPGSAGKMVVLVVEGEAVATVPYYDWYMAGTRIGTLTGFP